MDTGGGRPRSHPVFACQHLKGLLCLLGPLRSGKAFFLFAYLNGEIAMKPSAWFSTTVVRLQAVPFRGAQAQLRETMASGHE